MTDALLKRLREATEADRDLDAAIAVAITPTKSTSDDLVYAKLRDPGNDATHPGHYFLQSRSGASCQLASAYTSSVDSALTLVPEGEGSNFELTLEQYKRRTRTYWTATIGHMVLDAWDAEAPTPALAICIAALQARSSITSEEK